MSDELKKLYKVIQPVVFSVRREIGELLELTAEEAEHLAAFIVPADEAAQSSTDENSEQQSSEQTQNQNTEQNQTDQSQNTDQSQQPQNTNQNEQPSNTEGNQTGDQSQQQTA